MSKGLSTQLFLHNKSNVVTFSKKMKHLAQEVCLLAGYAIFSLLNANVFLLLWKTIAEPIALRDVVEQMSPKPMIIL